MLYFRIIEKVVSSPIPEVFYFREHAEQTGVTLFLFRNYTASQDPSRVYVVSLPTTAVIGSSLPGS